LNAAERYFAGDASMLLEFRGKDIIDGTENVSHF